MTDAVGPCPLIVVIEDSDEDFDTLREALQRSNYVAELRRAISGDDGLAQLREKPSARPLLVVMDLNTPGIDGREALAEIKADPALQGIPVVVLSTSTNPLDVAFCYAHGANAYQMKPVRYLDHLQALGDLFGYWLGRTVLPDVGGTGS